MQAYLCTMIYISLMNFFVGLLCQNYFVEDIFDFLYLPLYLLFSVGIIIKIFQNNKFSFLSMFLMQWSKKRILGLVKRHLKKRK